MLSGYKKFSKLTFTLTPEEGLRLKHPGFHHPNFSYCSDTNYASETRNPTYSGYPLTIVHTVDATSGKSARDV